MIYEGFSEGDMFGGGEVIPRLAYISSEDNISRMEQVAKLLKPSFDFIWNNFDNNTCLDIDDEGNFIDSR
jgi:hypothetical protein